SSGPDAIDAGAGADTLQAYDGQALLAGGRGDDNLTVSAADAVIAFNVGDGHDRVSVTAAFSVSLDTASSLALRRVGNDLVLGVGAQDSVTFTDWYAQAQAARPAARHFDG
ncbi:MAG TPA: hypothetical protein VFA81_02010, partial [Burkholderiales bacterium]|nr:hypothetical protein [Burkholderiales bacterium]